METMIEGSFVLYENSKKLSRVDFVAREKEIELVSTHVEKGEEGKGYASIIVKNALEFAKKFEKIRISCPYIKKWIEKHGFEREVEFTKKLFFKEAVDKFNKYRSPEAKAEIVEISDESAVVKMSGPFCVSCGVFDYFEDLAVEANAKVVNYREIDDGFIVRYELKEVKKW
ncbi:MAG: N-acetyltransferase [Archaeoglobaceae archaeon]|nr:N-acetyltransferase [Archaeoglobaceae archaeon]MCX8152714.1 N-acetyltransferase [Archaeoglobaceae archaeon]MDW8013421.1 N-acetyltransferase [Archaeoglobaceae archaeon]